MRFLVLDFGMYLSSSGNAQKYEMNCILRTGRGQWPVAFDFAGKVTGHVAGTSTLGWTSTRLPTSTGEPCYAMALRTCYAPPSTTLL
eukprot:2744808-Rhodomonas_salina.5